MVGPQNLNPCFFNARAHGTRLRGLRGNLVTSGIGVLNGTSVDEVPEEIA